MNLEKFLYKKIPFWILLLTVVLSIIVAILFGSAVTRSKTALKIANIPNTIKLFFRGYYDVGLKTERFKNKRGLHIYSPSLKKNYLLLSRYDGDLNRSVVELINLKEKKIIHRWVPDLKKLNSYSKNEEIINLRKINNLSRYVITHPWMFKNGDLLIHGQWRPLSKIDICSNIIWSLDYAFHHSLEKDHENNFWIPFTYMPSSISAGISESNGPIPKRFIDDGIMKVSENGEILFKKSVMQIFIDNNLEKLIFPGEPSHDPIHLNDIQPVLFDGNNFKKGDIFLSLRSISIVALYRPSSNKIIWYKKNPWVNQHDVDVLNNSQISIFNNKSKIMFMKGQNIYDESFKKNNNILIYDFDKDIVVNKYESLFEKHDIRTPTQGLNEIMEDGSLFVEESDFGRLLQFDSNGNLVLEYVNRGSDDLLYPLKWFRIIKNIDSSFIKKLNRNICNEK